MNSIKVFTNFSEEDFVGKWDGKKFPAIKPGKSMMLESYIAEHFAKHLIDRELNKKDIMTNNVVEREKLHKLCIEDTDDFHESKEIVETVILNKNRGVNEENLNEGNKNATTDDSDIKNNEVNEGCEVSIEMSRKELNALAETEGVQNVEELPNKQAVVDAILDARGELGDKDVVENELPEYAKPVVEKKDDEEEFDGK